MRDLTPLYISEIKEAVVKLGLKPFAAGQIFEWIHQKGALNLDAMTNLSLENRKLLKSKFFISSLEVEKTQKAKDGTQKFLYKLHDGERVESVIMDKTLCVSTQAGCPLNCGFCATGKIGFRRNLTAAEIINQVGCADLRTLRTKNIPPPISNVVFMGMGEPFLNYDNLMRAIRIINDEHSINIGARKMTVSTAGIPDKIIKFAKEGLQVRLAISLNAANDNLRSKLMPINRKYPLTVLIPAIKEYNRKSGRRVTLEYVMLREVNDSLDDLDELSELCHKVKANVNLIEYNPGIDGGDYKPSSPQCLRAFCDALKEKGIETVIRLKRGHDIQAACGQLRARP